MLNGLLGNLVNDDHRQAAFFRRFARQSPEDGRGTLIGGAHEQSCELGGFVQHFVKSLHNVFHPALLDQPQETVFRIVPLVDIAVVNGLLPIGFGFLRFFLKSQKPSVGIFRTDRAEGCQACDDSTLDLVASQ